MDNIIWYDKTNNASMSNLNAILSTRLYTTNNLNKWKHLSYKEW